MVTDEYMTTPTQRVGESEREPGEDMYYCVHPAGDVCCPWCGESFCDELGEPQKGSYRTGDGEEVGFPIEPEGLHKYTYHSDCYGHKQTEIHAAENASLLEFAGGEV